MTSKWAGMVRQIDGSEYPMTMTLHEGSIEVAYPTLGCGGTLTPIKLLEGAFQTVEHIERGAGKCDEGIRIVFKPGPAKRIDADFFRLGRLVAKGTMVKSPDFPDAPSDPGRAYLPELGPFEWPPSSQTD